ncbi:MAG: hypothetical protein ABJ205_10365 [Erythrobacter sp.]|uniref:hypothetical protein n=1 Tax=Erythrobacter sp. TaxID=1042 RepID=UPI0032668815
MECGKAPRPLFWWITAGVGAICAFATVLTAVLAATSIPFAQEGFALVKQHFGEPASVYPAHEVATFFLIAACLAALAAAYCWVLARIVRPPKDNRSVQSVKILAWLMLAMHIVLFPLGDAALVVETAFKGPTSEVAMAYEIIAFLALLTMFALAQAWATDERDSGKEGCLA